MRKVTKEEKKLVLGYIQSSRNTEDYNNSYDCIYVNTNIKFKKRKYRKVEYYQRTKERKIKMGSDDIQCFENFIQECEKIGYVIKISGRKGKSSFWGDKIQAYKINVTVGINNKEEEDKKSIKFICKK